MCSNERSKLLGWTTMASSQAQGSCPVNCLQLQISILCRSNLCSRVLWLYHIPMGRPEMDLEVTSLLVPEWRDGREEFHQPFLTSIPCAHVLLSSRRKLCCVTAKAEITHRITKRKRTSDCNSVSQRGKRNMALQFTLRHSVSILKSNTIQEVAWILLQPAQHQKQMERTTKLPAKQK